MNKEIKFSYEPHGHVVIGDLRVIENAKLMELVAKGPKYRDPSKVNWKATKTMFFESNISMQNMVQDRTSRSQLSL